MKSLTVAIEEELTDTHKKLDIFRKR